jgi:hypothetical protein
MLRFMSLRRKLKREALAALLALAIVPFVACAAIHASPSSPATDASPEVTQPHGYPDTDDESFLRRGLGALLTLGPLGGSDHPGATEGFIPDGASLSPFDTGHPAIANLEPELLDAVQRAASDARHDGIEVRISNGWRSAAYQQYLLDQAVEEYGSEAKARQFVNTPEQSTHVTGEAVDIATTDADSWLQQHGADYGLCQTYANEMWHFELMTEPGDTCPAPLRDASEG